MPLTHRRRLEDALTGRNPDRPPVVLWRHFPVDDLNAGTLAEAHIAWQRTYDWDLVKVTPPSSYFIYDWGAADEWRGHPHGTRDRLQPVVRQPEDWARLLPLDPQRGHLAVQAAALQRISDAFEPDTPVLATVFSPLAQARKLAGETRLLEHLRRHPRPVRAALDLITESTCRFIRAAAHAGISGIFYAIQHAQAHQMSAEEYARVARQDDLACLEAAGALWLNMLHLHGQAVHFDSFVDYPAQVINWHDQETPPGLSEALRKFPGLVCGGLRQEATLVFGTAEDVHREARAALSATGGRRMILGTGCVVPIIAPHGNLLAARQAVED
jgi:uroporphyrinogen decarboxylase